MTYVSWNLLASTQCTTLSSSSLLVPLNTPPQHNKSALGHLTSFTINNQRAAFWEAVLMGNSNSRTGSVDRPMRDRSIPELVMNDQQHIITLPFDINPWHWDHLRILARLVEKSWAWFTNPQKLTDSFKSGPRLGTLRYLPFEIRQQIYSHVFNLQFQDVFQKHPDLGYRGGVFYLASSTWYGGMHRVLDDYLHGSLLYRPHNIYGDEHVDIFYLSSYTSRDCLWPRSSGHLREASLSLRDEFDRFFFSKHTFKFRCPETMNRFISYLSTEQKKHLRKITLCLFRSCGSCMERIRNEDWIAACHQLTSSSKNLISVSFELGDVVHEWTSVSGIQSWNAYLDGPWKQRPAIKVQGRVRAAELLEVLGEQIVRSIPKVGISMSEETYFIEEDRDVFRALIRNIKRET